MLKGSEWDGEMKLILSGLATMGGLFWYLNGGAGGPDASREISKPTALVYSEMAALFPSGTIERSGIGRDGTHRSLKVVVKKLPDSSINYSMMLDGAEVLKMSLSFEGSAGGASTRVTGDLDVEQALVRFAATQNGSEARHLPEFAVDLAMDKMVDQMADALEGGQPLTKTMLFPLMNLSP